jgi:hypothetical protein
MEGFWVLSRTRQGGGWGVAPIGLESMRTYLDLIGCHRRAARLLFLELVLAMDAEFLRWSGTPNAKDRVGQPGIEHGECQRSNADTQG